MISGDNRQGGPSVQRLSEAEFEVCRLRWNALVKASGGDSLFQSWQWQFGWWRYFGRYCRNAELHIYILVDSDGDWIGLAPMYNSTYARRGFWSKACLQFIGTSWRVGRGVVSEYLGIILATPALKTSVLRRFVSVILQSSTWDECVLANSRIPPAAIDEISRHCASNSWLLRFESKQQTYNIDCTIQFESYLASLSQSTRRSLYGQRKKLATRGQIEVTTEPLSRGQFATAQLVELQGERFGSAPYKGDVLRFHESLQKSQHGEYKSEISLMTVGGVPVSAFHNVTTKSTVYNLHSGFRQLSGTGTSIAQLHIGFMIESECAVGQRTIDLLAGPGKSGANYKKRICTGDEDIATIRIVRNPIDRLLMNAREIAHSIFAAKNSKRISEQG